MRFIVLKTEVSAENTLNVFGLTEISHKASSVTPKWIDLRQAKTDCLTPENCDLLSFDDEDEVAEALEEMGLSDDSNISFIGVDV
ncbi:hypothetical protein QUB29_19480 [Microcoleus sp. B4b_D2]|uniref:hypothetical protein n=1 Tax=Microcoleus sp. B4b_D2 TaxID=3055310 RepID=UPI002FD5A253